MRLVIHQGLDKLQVRIAESRSPWLNALAAALGEFCDSLEDDSRAEQTPLGLDVKWAEDFGFEQDLPQITVGMLVAVDLHGCLTERRRQWT